MTTETSAPPKLRTITLTGRTPVKIREDDWPSIAEGLVDDWHASSGIRRDSTRTTTVSIRVRQHDDGRTIVYGIYEYVTHWQHEHGRTERAGILLPRPDGHDAPGRDTSLVWPELLDAIRQVGVTLAAQADDEDRVGRAVRDCIADLPAEEI